MKCPVCKKRIYGRKVIPTFAPEEVNLHLICRNTECHGWNEGESAGAFMGFADYISKEIYTYIIWLSHNDKLYRMEARNEYDGGPMTELSGEIHDGSLPVILDIPRFYLPKDYSKIESYQFILNKLLLLVTFS